MPACSRALRSSLSSTAYSLVNNDLSITEAPRIKSKREYSKMDYRSGPHREVQLECEVVVRPFGQARRSVLIILVKPPWAGQVSPASRDEPSNFARCFQRLISGDSS
jgi:hypothetical protein